MSKPTKFEKKVYEACSRIPKGKVTTYGEIAEFIGSGPRAVGNALNKNPFAPEVPCHRVVKSDGSVGGFASGCNDKIRILRSEGIEIKSSRVSDFESVLFQFEFIPQKEK